MGLEPTTPRSTIWCSNHTSPLAQTGYGDAARRVAVETAAETADARKKAIVDCWESLPEEAKTAIEAMLKALRPQVT